MKRIVALVLAAMLLLAMPVFSELLQQALRLIGT